MKPNRYTIAPALVLAPALALAASAGTAAAEEVLFVEFQERATGDSFRVENVAPCEGILITEVSINLASAASGLFFDVAPGEPGYPDEEQRIELWEGAGFVESVWRVEDGDQVLTIELEDFTPGDAFRIHIDVDNEDGRVPGPGDDASARDMEGATVAAKMFNNRGFRQAEIAAFGELANARISWPHACVEEDEEDAG